MTVDIKPLFAHFSERGLLKTEPVNCFAERLRNQPAARFPIWSDEETVFQGSIALHPWTHLQRKHCESPGMIFLGFRSKEKDWRLTPRKSPTVMPVRVLALDLCYGSFSCVLC